MSKVLRRKRIHFGIRKKISGTSAVPRVSIFRSNVNIYAQAIDDVNGVTLAAVSSKGAKLSGSKSEVASQIGKQLGEKLKSAKVETIVFDRAGYLYHGRVKALAEGLRETGIKF